MYTFVIVLIIIACALLMAIILIQNPKGGGLGQTFGGLSNQFLGVQRTTDFLEKSTWVLIAAIAILSISTFIFSGSAPTDQVTGPRSELENEDLGGPALPTDAVPITPPDTTGQ